jgi:hypothetical protein
MEKVVTGIDRERERMNGDRFNGSLRSLFSVVVELIAVTEAGTDVFVLPSVKASSSLKSVKSFSILAGAVDDCVDGRLDGDDGEDEAVKKGSSVVSSEGDGSEVCPWKTGGIGATWGGAVGCSSGSLMKESGAVSLGDSGR